MPSLPHGREKKDVYTHKKKKGNTGWEKENACNIHKYKMRATYIIAV
jgi:hypothetical protein